MNINIKLKKVQVKLYIKQLHQRQGVENESVFQNKLFEYNLDRGNELLL